MKNIAQKLLLLILFFLTLTSACILFSPDPMSEKLRGLVESNINSYIEGLADRASEETLTSTDKRILQYSVSAGVIISSVKYPEAANLLKHYIHGDGSDLELDSSYFHQSEYLSGMVSKLGTGDHGPLALRQAQDWRLSLALNPYYLNITTERIRLYHPEISFAAAGGEIVFTIVPVGKLNLRVYDNLISALNPTPFFVFSEWAVE